MSLQALRQAEAIGMCILRIGRMCAGCHFGAERGGFGVENGSRCRARQKGLEHKRIEGEGGEPLPQHFLKSCPRLAHRAHKASKSCGGQAAREDVMRKLQPITGPLGNQIANLLKKWSE